MARGELQGAFDTDKVGPVLAINEVYRVQGNYRVTGFWLYRVYRVSCYWVCAKWAWAQSLALVA